MMSTPDAPFGGRRGWIIGLALLSLIVPVAAVCVRSEPLVPFADPVRLSSYRQIVAALGVGLACALAAFAGARTMPASGSRRLSMGLVSGSLLLSVYVLWVLIGSCGVQVIGGNCQP